MRDLLFKNLTSSDKRKRILTSSEIVDKQGVRSIIHRHLVCIIKEINPLANNNQIKDERRERPLPSLYVLKEHNNKEQKEKFLCRIKGSMYVISNGRLFFIRFMHSLKINLISIAQDVREYTD